MRFEPTPRPALAEIPGSLIREVSEVGRYMPDVIPLWFGEPDTVTPDFVREAAKLALDEGKTFYAPNPGIPPLREAIAAYLKRNNRPVGTARVAVTASGVNALMLVAQALLSPGDRVVIPTPAWPNMDGIARVMGAEVADMPLRLMNGVWRADLDELLAAITPQTKLLFLNSPGNPTGWTLTGEEQRAILAKCRQTGTWILADDVYERLYFAGDAAPSFLEIADEQDRVVSVNSFSKSWAMTGWRLGFTAGNPDAVNTLQKLKSNIDSKAFPAVAEAGAYALNHVSNQATLDIYQRRRDALVDGLRSIGWQVERPVASLYVWAPVPNPDMTSAEFAKALLEKAHVLCIPGNGYGTAGEGYVRFSLTLLGDQSGERFAEAVRRIAASGLIAAPVA